tara:strand:- start:1416 stop:2687 length:1272 start_codon:yes stop_codon:yes gene_type:complete
MKATHFINKLSFSRFNGFLIKLYYSKFSTQIKIKNVRFKQNLAVKRLKKKDSYEVVFFALFDSIWKYEELYKLLENDERFNATVVIIPHILDNKVQMDTFNKALNYFTENSYKTISPYNEKDNTWLDIKALINPDIIFFTVPYAYTLKKYTIYNFQDKLTCYVPYAFMVGNEYELFFNSDFHNFVWKAYYETSVHKKIGIKYAYNKGRNIEVTGFPGCDNFMTKTISSRKTKKIIWAPHHLMKEVTKQSNFLENYNLIFEISEKYSDRIELIFKPHPLLKQKLYSYPEWGKKRTDDYFNKIKESNNIVIEEGEYVDLFLSSDALIHDCGSFITEYIYTKKPSLFLLKNDNIINNWNDYGKEVMSVLYKGQTDKDVFDFIDDTVFNQNDYMKEKRLKFLEEVILPPNGNTASCNIYKHLINTID